MCFLLCFGLCCFALHAFYISYSYMYFHFAIDNIYEYNPDMKLIMFLREPISRAYSQYSMDRGNGVNVFHSDDIHFSDDEDSFLDSVRST